MQEFTLQRDGEGSPLVIGRVFTDPGQNGHGELPVVPFDNSEIKALHNKVAGLIDEFQRVLNLVCSFEERLCDFEKQLAVLQRDVEDIQISKSAV
jgi:hypothetical protein